MQTLNRVSIQINKLFVSNAVKGGMIGELNPNF
jgi:hypothetical protein